MHPDSKFDRSALLVASNQLGACRVEVRVDILEPRASRAHAHGPRAKFERVKGGQNYATVAFETHRVPVNRKQHSVFPNLCFQTKIATSRYTLVSRTLVQPPYP
eukprot:scaffold111164_cov69-Phaeocystis_antarctica.AAC.4